MKDNNYFPELDAAEHESPFLNEVLWEQERPFMELTYEAESSSPFLNESNFDDSELEDEGNFFEADHGYEEALTLQSFGSNFSITNLRSRAKIRTASEAAARGGVNTISSSKPSRKTQEIDAVVLHHMAFDRGNNTDSYLKVVSHYIILRDGTIGQLWDHNVVLNASNGFNSRGIAIEFAGNFPNDKGRWWYSKSSGPVSRSNNEHRPTIAQISAGQFLLQHLKRSVPGIKYVFAHRQSSDSRTNDPGPDIWFSVAEWAINQAGYDPQSREIIIAGKGEKIPDNWRRWGAFQTQVQFHYSSGQPATAPQTPSSGATSSTGSQPASVWSYAAEKNRYWGTKLGWNQHVYTINDLLLPLMGRSNVSLSEEAFAQGISIWQRNNGFSGKDVDGIIGPNTWKKLQNTLFSSQETMEYYEAAAEMDFYEDENYVEDYIEDEYDYEFLEADVEGDEAEMEEDEYYEALPDEHFGNENLAQHELEELFFGLGRLSDWWKSQNSPSAIASTAAAIGRAVLGSSSTGNYWQDVKNRAACIAEREWAAWDKGKRHESDALSWDALMKYFSTVKTREAAEQSANSNKRISGKGTPWSAAFISYLFKTAGAGSYFIYDGAHYTYMVASKKNRKSAADNPFQLFGLKEAGAKPEVGDLVCNYRGCFKMTYNNIEQAASSSCTNSEGDKAAKHAHCDIIVKVEQNKVWVIGGNTSDSVTGTSSTVGKKSRRLDANGFLVEEKNIFAILKVRTDINASSPANEPFEGCDGKISGGSEPQSAVSSTATNWNYAIGENRKWGTKLGWNARVDEINDLLLPLVGMQNVSLGEALFAEAVSIWQAQNGFGRKDVDGIIGPNTWKKMESQLGRSAGGTTTAPSAIATTGQSGTAASSTPTLPSNPNAYRKFRLTTYHVVDQGDFPTGSTVIAFLDKNGNEIAEGSPSFFAKVSLEGTGKLLDGRLINVAGANTPAKHADYSAVLDYHNVAYESRNRKNLAEGKDPVSFGYSGLVVSGGIITSVKAFHIISASKIGAGYGTLRGIPLVPFRTLAADLGLLKRHEPSLKGSGGLVPAGTQVYIKEYDGLQLPDKSIHDGWFTVNDTGGAIFGVHFDVFVGTAAFRKQVKLPEFGRVWFNGIEQRIPSNYTYGLSK